MQRYPRSDAGPKRYERAAMNDTRFAGIGMTSARTRDRLVQRLREQGIANLAVLDRIRNLPRHIFVDEALARAARSCRSGTCASAMAMARRAGGRRRRSTASWWQPRH